MRRLFTTILLSVLVVSTAMAEHTTYKRPPQEIEEMVLAKSAPRPVLNRDCTAAIMLYSNRHMLMSEMPIDGGLFLATLHINPEKFCRTYENGYHTISFKQIPDGEEVKVTGLGKGTIIQAVWYPTGDKALIFNREKDGVYLYSAAMTDGIAKRISDRRINTTVGKFVLWVNDTDFISTCVVEERGTLERHLPTGPVVQESLGKKTRKRTAQGFLYNEFDQEAFKHYFTSQLVRFSPSGEKKIGIPAIFRTMKISPNGSYLMIYRVYEPYAYETKYMSLRSKVTIEDLEGNVVKRVKHRGHLQWRPDKPATLVWRINAKKGTTDYKASIYQQEAPFTEPQQLVVRLPMSYEALYWCNDSLAVVKMAKSKRVKYISAFNPSDNGAGLTPIVNFHTHDYYNLPYRPVMVTNQYGRKVLWTNEQSNEILFTSKGYTPDGQVPKLLLYKIGETGHKIAWESKAPYFEDIVAPINPTERIFVTARESLDEPKNYYLSDLKNDTREAITNLTEQYPALKGIKREIMNYKRADGLPLKSTVYLPAGYDPTRDGKLPILMWGYPRTTSVDKIQKFQSYSPYRHITPGSIRFWVTQGYCVMESVDMPLVPIDGKKRANDTFVKQLVMNAEAAIKALDEAGYGDPNRAAIGGHSYGAFMTAHLLTHSKLFRAGIARSGAYNRSLTPYGFQNEGRNYWDANKLYRNMSPFEHADKLSGALLLIHGSKDSNAGTHTIQSERYFQALRGHNKFVRYVELPLERHGYRIRENVLHYLYEANLWLEKYVKNAEPTDVPKEKKKKSNND
ncbi:MAG: S9 family peptidase [Rikenellaceae bacterium]|nr:S9 family peptidase [Rikenellaceae bacterium]